MEDEDGTCLLDVLCDPQALNDFLHGTSELQPEDLLISSSSGETSLFPDAASPVSLLGGAGGDSPDTPPPGCVDLSFLEEALLSSPEAAEEPGAGRAGAPAEGGVGEAEEEEEAAAAVACDILQQSLQEAEITEQTMALEAGLTQPEDSLSLYSPAPLLPPPPAPAPFLPKPVTLPTQAAVEPPQPSLLAVGPGCPSLKPAAPPQLMGLLPGNVFPAAPPDASFSQGSSMIIHKAVPGAGGRPVITQTLRMAAAAPPGLVLQRGPLPIQPKLPRLVQISPKPPGQKPPAGLTFVPRTASSNLLLPPGPGQKAAGAAAPGAAPLPKPVSLQLVNQGGSFLLQPQGLFQGQNQFLLPGQSPVTISQPARAAQSHHGAAFHRGQLVDGPQILTVPQRQLNFGPVFTTPAGQLALRQATVLSGPLQLQSAPAAVFQMGAYAAGGPGPRATLVHGPALANHITLINSSGVLPPDLTSISIVNGPPVVQGLPFAAQAPPPPPAPPPPAVVPEGALSLQQASVVLLPDRAAQEETTSSEETFQQLQQPFGQVVQQVPVRPVPTGPQSSAPPVVSVLQRPPELPAVEMPKLLLPPADLSPAVEEVTRSRGRNQAFMQHLQQEALSPLPSELLVGTLPAVPMEPLMSPGLSDGESQPTDVAADAQDAVASPSDRRVEVSPPRSDPEDEPLICSPARIQDAAESTPASVTFSPPAGPPTALLGPECSPPPPPSCVQPQVKFHVSPELQPSQTCDQSQAATPVQFQVSPPRPSSLGPAHSSPSVPPLQQQLDPAAVLVSTGGDESAAQQHTHNQPAAALVVEDEAFALAVLPPSPAASLQTGPRADTEPAGRLDIQSEEKPTPAARRHRFQQQFCSDHAAVQNPITSPAFATLKDAVRHLLPFHTCAGHLPTQDHFTSVDQEFDTVSGFLLKRTKDMVNKYRQLLVRETQQESPSAEMVMLERLFLQAERYTLAEERRRARRDPETFHAALTSSAPPPHLCDPTHPSGPAPCPSGPAHPSGPTHPGGPAHCPSGPSHSPSSPPAWTRLSSRPPGLRTYRSSSRGALRLTIKQESGSRKVVHNSACDPGLKRDHTGQLTNGGGGAADQRPPLTPNGDPGHSRHDEVSNGALNGSSPDLSPGSKTRPPDPPRRDGCFGAPPRDASAPKLRCYRREALTPPLQEDHVLSEHLQSAIDSILELQRLQGPLTAPGRPAGPARPAPGPSLDQAVTSILEGQL
ncbi:BRD4-interacting chromatin-remodeling complex-associated protein [Cololabis saira]|uniref:BRD4-interacting chromatin-remodeling complex-associated protein n=1 Tax=Cololabis saira TaxID=129043 RepID=UPI002AD259E5|nr:BRD4-interacting chromatin-remodeling complex-associated protein [Cololabis saira]